MTSSTTILPDAPLAERRAAFDALMTRLPVPADVTARAVRPGGVPASDVRIEGGGDERVLLHLHGGAYVMGSGRAAVRTAAALARSAGARAVAPDYRLAPEHPHPAALQDALAAYRGLLEAGTAPERIAVTGESAGGGLAISLLVALVRDHLPLPGAAVVLSPWTDLTLSGTSYREREGVDPILSASALEPDALGYGGARRADPLVSPLFADLRGLPPLLVQVGSLEVLLDDATQLAARAAAAHVETVLEVYPGATHVFQHRTGELPLADEAVERAGAFLSRVLAPPAGTGGRGR